MPAERRKAAQAAHDTLTAASSKRGERAARAPPAEKKLKFEEWEKQVSALDITVAGKSITETLKLTAEPTKFKGKARRLCIFGTALIGQSYGWGASGKVTIPVTVTTKEGEEKKEYTAADIPIDGTKPAPRPKAAKSESEPEEEEADA